MVIKEVLRIHNHGYIEILFEISTFGYLIVVLGFFEF
jgi:hypothetical protein